MGQRAVGVTRSQLSTKRLASLWEESRRNPCRCGKMVWRDKVILLGERRCMFPLFYHIRSLHQTGPRIVTTQVGC